MAAGIPATGSVESLPRTVKQRFTVGWELSLELGKGGLSLKGKPLGKKDKSKVLRGHVTKVHLSRESCFRHV
jgi:hypothetical protein